MLKNFTLIHPNSIKDNGVYVFPKEPNVQRHGIGVAS